MNGKIIFKTAYLKTSHRALSLTEIIVGVALFAFALIPSFTYLMSSVKQTSATDMENTAGIIASSVLDRILDNIDYEDVNADLKLDQISGITDEDGIDNNELKTKSVVYKLSMDVKTAANDKIEFGFRKTPYIKRQSGKNIEADAENSINKIMADDKRWKSFIKLKLSDITKHKKKTFLKEIILNVSWKDPNTGRDRNERFVTLKANLTLVEQQGG